jgi:uncharacterized BrkB/YihY/UPF0761 family membrane protein
MTPTNPLWMIAATQSANNHHHYHQYNPDENAQLLAVLIALIILPVLWIVFTSIRQLVIKDLNYDFVEDNIMALISLAVIGGATLFMVLVIFIYTLIK